MGIEAILALVAQLLPEILATAPKVGLAIHNLFSQNADALPDEVKAALADVKLRQAVEDAEWRADLPAGEDVAAGGPNVEPPAPAAAPEAAAALKAQAGEILRLTNELAAARQAGYGAAPAPESPAADAGDGPGPVEP